MRVQPGVLHEAERPDEAQHRTEQADQRSQLCDRGQQTQLLLQTRHFSRTRLLQRLAHPLPALVAIQDGDLHQPRHRPGGGITNGKRFDDIIALEHRANAVKEPHRVNLRTVTMQKALDKDRYGHRADEQEQPQHRPAVEQQYRQR